MGSPSKLLMIAVGCCSMLWGPAAYAQSDVAAESGSGFQFNFSNPGAKSLGMAGALTGLGDDATGAWTNPAGLLNLSRPEVSFEFRSFDNTSRYVSGGRVSGSPTGIGVDTVANLVERADKSRSNALSFSSLVVPAGGWAIAGYLNQAARFTSTVSTDGAFRDVSGGTARLRPTDGELDLSIATYGVAVARRLSDTLFVGGSVSVYDFSLDTYVQRYSLNSGALGAPGTFFGPALRDNSNIIFKATQVGDNTKVGAGVGLAWNASEQVRVGASYRYAPKFDVTDTENSGPASSTPNQVLGVHDASFNVPDVLSLGLLVRPVPELSLVVDYRFIRYSELVEDFNIYDGSATPDEFTVDDGSEIRFGAQYLIRSVAVRGGVWYDPDHHIRFTPKDGRFNANSIIYREGDDLVHGSGGLGLIFRNFQVDVGVDYSKDLTTVSASTVIRF